MFTLLFLNGQVISKTNSNACNNLNTRAVTPNISSYDPKVFTSFTIDSSDTAMQVCIFIFTRFEAIITCNLCNYLSSNRMVAF